MLGALSLSVKLQLLSKNVQPGEALSGVVYVNVRDAVNITAVRVHITGTESGFVRATLATTTRTIPFLSKQFDSLITLFGHSKTSGRRGGVTLSKGKYSYPFRCLIPPTVPPSYRCSIDMASGALVYEAKAYVDIPNSYNAKDEATFVVWPAVPLWQVQQARVQSYVVPPVDAMAYTQKGFCCRGKGKPIQICVEMTPVVLVTNGGEGDIAEEDNTNKNGVNNDTTSYFDDGNYNNDCGTQNMAVDCATAGDAPAGDAPAGEDDDGYNTSAVVLPPTPPPIAVAPSTLPPNVLTVYVTLRNISSTCIRTVTVKLTWRAVFDHMGFIADEVKTICKRSQPVPYNNLQRDGSITLRFDLSFEGALRVDTRMGRKHPCATLKTPTVEVFTAVNVYVSDLGQDDMVIKGIVQLSSRIDETNNVPAAPVYYVNECLLPENTDMAS